jgi:ribosome-associated translation inhibitor RaiA
MRTIVKGKNYEVPDRVREYAQRKLGRLERLLDDRSDAPSSSPSSSIAAPRIRISSM